MHHLKPWISPLLILTLLFESAHPLRSEICQLTECSLQHLSPVQFPPCASKFDLGSLRPVVVRRWSRRRGHLDLFDLFPSDHQCMEVNFMVALQDDRQGFLTLHVAVECRGSGKVMFVYESSGIWSVGCIRPIPIHEGMYRACSYHDREQLRFTAIGNDTLLVEDLSLTVPPGTRMIMRSANGSNSGIGRQCECRSLLRDKKRLGRCINYYTNRINNEEQFRQVREKWNRDFRIGLVILISSCCCTMLMRCWATRKIANLEYITNFVYP